MRRRLLIAVLAGAVATVIPLGTAAAVSPTFRLTIMHTVENCHVWMTTRALGASTTIRLKPGTRLELRSDCPMDFDLAQTAGPKLVLGGRLFRGTTRVIRFVRAGVYRLTATNVQTPEQAGLQILGTPNTLQLTIVVR